MLVAIVSWLLMAMPAIFSMSVMVVMTLSMTGPSVWWYIPTKGTFMLSNSMSLFNDKSADVIVQCGKHRGRPCHVVSVSPIAAIDPVQHDGLGHSECEGVLHNLWWRRQVTPNQGQPHVNIGAHFGHWKVKVNKLIQQCAGPGQALHVVVHPEEETKQEADGPLHIVLNLLPLACLDLSAVRDEAKASSKGEEGTGRGRAR
jgi:hypothetical protein